MIVWHSLVTIHVIFHIFESFHFPILVQPISPYIDSRKWVFQRALTAEHIYWPSCEFGWKNRPRNMNLLNTLSRTFHLSMSVPPMSPQTGHQTWLFGTLTPCYVIFHIFKIKRVSYIQSWVYSSSSVYSTNRARNMNLWVTLPSFPNASSTYMTYNITLMSNFASASERVRIPCFESNIIILITS